ncbi:stage III sporulation protein AF [uncultured Dysosmobacter sp.]|uniref:stage III sporulation protein AF n=1 Tax=uncultured Dysosmobacter sp. TaxID=2591384 RepID=UPI002637D7CD|nr:stage III sporulation protein AF [uncultured Dysosmobacter sp.]
MIGAVREWLTAIVASSILLSAVQTLLPDGTARRIAAFTGGLLLLAVMLRPVLGVELERLDLGDYEAAVEQRRQELEEVKKEELESLIAERTAAYISDKAASLDLSVTARVETEPGPEGIPIPAAVHLEGQRSEELAAYMERDLGISRERQVWHEEN